MKPPAMPHRTTGVSTSDLNTPAQLQTAIDTPTAQGGRTRVWTTVSVIWISLRPALGKEITGKDLPPRRRELASAIARDNPALVRGVRLVIGAEAPWLALSARRRDPVPGLVSLILEREA